MSNLKTLQQLKDYLSNIENVLDKESKEFYKNQLKFNEYQISDFKDNNFNYLYPNFFDPEFNIKIAEKKEFNDLKYDSIIKNVKTESDKLCNAEFELSPHQIFVRNFLSFLTPYNSLLLYHGLGSGKTCSAITVCEEMRDYMKQMGIKKRIIIVASPNVQDNFKTQLFDERKLKLINGLWNIKACVGNKIIKEINPMNMKGLTKEKIVNQVKKIIRQNYLFMGYIEFSNYIEKIKSKISDDNVDNKIKLISKEFSNRLIVIDEVHNIRISGDSPNKKVAQNLLDMVKYTNTLKLLLLSATPMFNSYKEIVWILNLMNINDNRPPIDIKDVFDKEGNFKIKDGKEIGKELFIRKMTGYVSFIRGQDPYKFPYRIFPSLFIKEKTLKNKEYPRIQINGKRIIQGIEYIDLFLTNIGKYQKYGYELAINKLKKELPNEEDIDSGLGWQQIEPPLQTLNFVYPNPIIDKYIENEEIDNVNIREFIGANGLNNIMNYNKENKNEFSYSPYTLEKYGKVFSQERLNEFSSKLYNVTQNIKKSKGIVLIYSQYIDGGCVPIALALEEMGITRYGNKSLFKDEPVKKIDAVTMKEKEKGEKFNPAKYIMITGDKKLSPNNLEEYKAATNEDNINGEKVKVIIISKAGSEGLDFNNLRQVHIMEPWYNLSRIDQIEGRAIRFCSHKNLPFKNRNVEIYLYSTYLNDEIETIDLYVYRMAEMKAINIGQVSRVMKENAVDCYLNSGINNLSEERMNQNVKQELSSGKVIDYRVGDKPFSQICDYMEKCEYVCKPVKDKLEVNLDTYNENFVELNIERIITKIKDLYKEKYIYKKEDLIKEIIHRKKYSNIEINNALNYLVTNKNEFIFDMFGRNGNLVNIGEYYMFQPVEINDVNISRYNRVKPIDYKKEKINYKLSKKVKDYVLFDVSKKKQYDEKVKKIFDSINENLDNVFQTQEVKRGEKNWYIHSSKTIDRLSDKINKDLLKDFILQHIIDKFNYNDKRFLIEYLINNESDLNSLERKIKDYIEKTNMVENYKNKGYILINNSSLEFYVLDEDENKLKKAEKLDIEDFKEVIINKLKIDKNKYNNIIGFMMNIEKIDNIKFKTKDMKLKRHKGARCDQAGKQTNIKILNKIYEEDKYDKNNTKDFRIQEMCSEQELLLRYYNSINKNDKVWFLTYEQAIYNEIEKINI